MESTCRQMSCSTTGRVLPVAGPRRWQSSLLPKVARLPQLSSPGGPSRCTAAKASRQNFLAATFEVADEEGTGELELYRQGYRSIKLEGCEFLIATTADGLLDLRDVYVKDDETDIYARPSVYGELPEQPQRYAEVAWVVKNLGDRMQDMDAWQRTERVYLVQVERTDPTMRMNLEEVYSLDNTSRDLCKEEVTRLTEETNPQNITLRIRPEGLTIEENSQMPDAEQVVYEYEVEQARIKDGLMDGDGNVIDSNDLAEKDEEEVVARDPIDAMNDDEREYDETMEDVPEVDQGY